jgi:DNA mismatch endonuclease (patch repair protein)
LPGKPDIVLRKYRLVIFVDGAFWHGYNWDGKKDKIKSNRDFWIPKIERNIQRDQEVNQELLKLGYNVIRFWDHQINKDFNWCLQIIFNCVSEFLHEDIID